MSVSPKIVVVTGAGALGRTYVRALVLHGHQVRVVDRTAGTLRAFTHPVANAFDLLPRESAIEVAVQALDLRRPGRDLDALMRGAHAVVMTAANPLPTQSEASAAENRTLDLNTIDAALAGGVETIVYTSSVWRLAKLMDGDDPIRPELAAPDSHYGHAKQATWEAMKRRAADHPHVQFVVNDHGWYPRELAGAPPTNVGDRGMQTWVAEAETQAHVLRQLELGDRRPLAGNFHGFIVSSRNVPSAEAVRAGHRPFILDLSNSERIGVEHRANVYQLFDQYRQWRTVPVYLE